MGEMWCSATYVEYVSDSCIPVTQASIWEVENTGSYLDKLTDGADRCFLGIL